MITFSFTQGIDISENIDIKECYQINAEEIVANISAEHLIGLIKKLIKKLDAPLYFFIEIPCSEEKEEAISGHNITKYHKDVYYLDNCTTDVVIAIMNRYGDLLINDGLVQFGFGSHNSEEEIYIKMFKVISIFSRSIHKFADAFESMNIPRTKNIKTIWDIINEDTPASRTSVEVNGETIFDIIENLKNEGMYFSHTCEE